MADQKSFPSTKAEALALAYVQSQNWNDRSYLSFLEKYELVHEEIVKALEEKSAKSHP